jgi:hypothetical protein
MCFWGPWSLPRASIRNLVLEPSLKECNGAPPYRAPPEPSAASQRVKPGTSPPGFFLSEHREHQEGTDTLANCFLGPPELACQRGVQDERRTEDLRGSAPT